MDYKILREDGSVDEIDENGLPIAKEYVRRCSRCGILEVNRERISGLPPDKAKEIYESSTNIQITDTYLSLKCLGTAYEQLSKQSGKPVEEYLEPQKGKMPETCFPLNKLVPSNPPQD